MVHGVLQTETSRHVRFHSIRSSGFIPFLVCPELPEQLEIDGRDVGAHL